MKKGRGGPLLLWRLSQAEEEELKEEGSEISERKLKTESDAA